MYTTPNLTERLHSKNIVNHDYSGKTIVIRSCLNVPLNKSGEITDFSRLEEALPALKKLGETASKLVILAHLGRPTTAREAEFSLKPVQKELEKRLGEEVVMIENEDGFSLVRDSSRKYFLLENIRFFEGEEGNDVTKREGFAKRLAELGDVYVNDAFPDYRKAASTYDIAKFLPSFLGPVFVREVKALSEFSNPERPFVAVLGGAKLSEKLDALKSLAGVADKVLIGGAMAYTLMKSQGLKIGNSLFEEEKLAVASEIMEQFGDKIVLPVDHVVSDEFSADSEVEKTTDEKVPEGKVAVDIGIQTQRLFSEHLSKAQSILWNGPMGVFEWDNTQAGTRVVGEAITGNRSAYKLAGGGDSIAAINKFNLTGFDHVSTGGGAMLAFISYDRFPTLDIILDRK